MFRPEKGAVTLRLAIQIVDMHEIRQLIRQGAYEFSMHAQQERLVEDVERSTDERRKAMTDFGDCTFCGGEVEETRIEYDYRRRGQLLVISNVSAGACQQCGETYFKPDVLKKMDEAYHDIFDCHKEPERVLAVPAVSL